MRHIKHLIIISLTLLFAATTIGMVGSGKAYADAVSASKDSACQSASLGDAASTCASNNGSGLTSAVKTIISILSLVIGVAAIIMVIIGGFRFVLSSGDSNNTNSARNTIIYALIGLAIAALAQVLVHFVLGRVSGCPAGQTFIGNPASCKPIK